MAGNGQVHGTFDLAYLKVGIKADTLAALRTVPLHLPTLFLYSVIKQENVKNVASSLPVGARLQIFWQTWLDLGAGPKVVQILKTDKVSHSHKLLCQSQQKPLPAGGIPSAYRQKCSGTTTKPNISGIFQPTVLVPKPNNKWRPILDLSKLNLFLKAEKFKMETPETIRTSLQPGEWVTLIDFKDAYFHIPIQEWSRKYLRFHVQGQTNNSKFCLLVYPQHPWSSLL